MKTLKEGSPVRLHAADKTGVVYGFIRVMNRRALLIQLSESWTYFQAGDLCSFSPYSIQPLCGSKKFSFDWGSIPEFTVAGGKWVRCENDQS